MFAQSRFPTALAASLAGINPHVAKAGGHQSQGAKGAAVVHRLQALGNAGSGVLRLLQEWG